MGRLFEMEHPAYIADIMFGIYVSAVNVLYVNLLKRYCHCKYGAVKSNSM